MVDLVLTLCVVVASPAAAGLGALVGRRSAHAGAQVAAAVTALAFVSGVVLAVILTLTHLIASESSVPKPERSVPTLGGGAIAVDSLAALMLLLVLGLSWIIQLFAIRYLRGDSRQVWFVVCTNLLTGSTVLMVCATTVVGFAAGWLAAGMSLVALLGTYGQLDQARDGVRRTGIRLAIGDSFFVLAVLALLVSAGGDVALRDLAWVTGLLPGGLTEVLVVLLVIAALARSSQIPFHGWLPATLAAPTPVSALMHAGVVNAGAILILRFSPAIGESRLAMAVIFTAGALTLVYASVVRMVKPDVKGRLVFSTMGQMGFMMVACGMGAFAAAVFHLIAHGLFKSALFLGAGSGVGREAVRRALPVRTPSRWMQGAVAVTVALVVPALAIALAQTVLQPELSAANGALQLFAVFTAGIALGTALWVRLTAATALLGTLAVIALAFGYSALVHGVDAALDWAPASGAVAAIWLALPAVALLSLQLLTIGGNTSVIRRAYAWALASGTPARSGSRHSIPAQEGFSA